MNHGFGALAACGATGCAPAPWAVEVRPPSAPFSGRLSVLEGSRLGLLSNSLVKTRADVTVTRAGTQPPCRTPRVAPRWELPLILLSGQKGGNLGQGREESKGSVFGGHTSIPEAGRARPDGTECQPSGPVPAVWVPF